MPPISIKHLIRRFWRKTLLTWVLVLLEGVSLVVMPMAIGRSVDGLMTNDYSGIVELSALCAVLLVVGGGRRFYDTRVYARIYRSVVGELVGREQRRNASLSRISARVNLFTEFTHFLETSVPSIIHQFIALFGTLIIIIFLDWRVLLACALAVAITAVIYGVSQKRIYRLNQGGNDEIERQVDVLKSGDEARIQNHFKSLMNWQIRLSDLETVNYSLIWTALGAVLVFSVVIVTSSGEATFGEIVATVMYVFGFIESTMAFPLYYQQLIRLQEIATRLGREDNPEDSDEPMKGFCEA